MYFFRTHTHRLPVAHKALACCILGKAIADLAPGAADTMSHQSTGCESSPCRDKAHPASCTRAGTSTTEPTRLPRHRDPGPFCLLHAIRMRRMKRMQTTYARQSPNLLEYAASWRFPWPTPLQCILGRGLLKCRISILVSEASQKMYQNCSPLSSEHM